MSNFASTPFLRIRNGMVRCNASVLMRSFLMWRTEAGTSGDSRIAIWPGVISALSTSLRIGRRSASPVDLLTEPANRPKPHQMAFLELKAIVKGQPA